ncbi:hypothetical protein CAUPRSCDRAFT_11277 [Caulochytrium protostelioides]|uniref:Dynein heavy chain, cytosolic n=1 Tax=Caulochytrium protostelioides TaxID=1555241 RepID=A0A4P9WWF9_9FUNG|nr:hypothetical protein CAUPRSCDRAFT_11277 [Caulochytrium protostelioides]
MLLVGPTGTGKTAYINHRLLSMTSHRVIFVNFSAQTTAQDVLEIVLGKLDKRRKSVFGPPQGTKCVVFLDDLNMPAKEKYGAQPPLELVRQFLDHGMWYDTQALVPIQLVDISLMAAMGEPGGGRSVISNRVTRHFSTFGITEFDTPTLMQIFGTIMQWHLTSASFTTAVQSLAPRLVAATCSIYRDCVENLYPTPTKGHYLFNLRDFSRVVEGLLLMTPEKFTEPTKTQRLWVHEVFRVFYDRLVTPEDRVWFFGAVKQQLSDHFRVEADTLFEHLRRPGSTEPLTDEDLRGNVFGDFGAPTGAATSAAKGYDQVDEMDLLSSFIRSRLDEFNQVSKAPMQLIIFRFAAEHIARIARALRQPGGHMLLVGMGGSGRQSLTRLAAYMADYPLFSIEITKSYSIKDWREDIKKILIKAGGQPSQPVVFMLNDTQIKYESFLEDINNLLNTGDVPNLFEPEEKAALIEAMRSVWATMPNFSKNTIMTPNMLYNIFVDRVKENLHVVLCMSPVGDAFRSRLRKFPSIVNCCTIDWFQAWPADALEMVAQRALDRLGLSDSEKVVVVQMCREFHMDTIQLSEQFYTQLRRQNYVTPMSYLNLIRVFSRLLQTKRQEIEARKGRYVTGLSQLASASSQVSVMQTELENLQPQLIKTGEETAEMMKIIERETIQVNEKRALVQVDERAANLKADAARAIKEDCEAQLAEALPALEEAMSALDILKPQDISLVKSMKNPPFPVKLVMEAICIMRGIKPARVKVNGKMVEDFWGPAQKLLSDSHFLQDLKAYDKDNIDPKIIERIRKTYISNAEFDPDIVKNSSSAAEGLCRWIRAMDKYEAVSKVVKPKKAALAVAEDELNTEMVKLRSKQAELKEVEDKMASLQAQFEQMTAKKADLEAQVKLCGEKLVRAEQLIGGLGGEKSRWQASAEELDTRLTTIVGDMLLSSGIIAYLGAFTASFRVSVIKKWMASLKAKGLTASQNYSLPAVIGDQVVIRNWQLAGLPSDAFSTENALIANNSDGWPLFIDPQGQANKWVKQLEKERLVVIKPTDADYMRQLETAVQFGKPILLEDVGEELDAALEPLLLRQTFKQGGVLCIKLGETVVEYSPDFHLYISTKIRNPRYMPELTTKVTLINFMLTPEGLEDQLLSIVAAQERPELEKEKNELVIASAANNEQLAEIENSILGILTKSQGNLLEDESAINALTNSKLISDKIAEKQKVASVTEKEIDLTRQGYRPIAKHGSVLFFAIADLANIEPMYQYSLVWFVGIFLASISDAPKSDVLEERLSGLTKHFTYSLYCNVCRSVFKKDKLLFSFLLTVSIQREAGDMTADEWSFFLSGVGAIPQEKQLKNPHPEIISTAIWLDLQLLAAKVPAFGRSLLESFSHPDDIILWRNVLESSEPWGERLPRGWSESTKPFQRLLLLKIMRLDKLIGSVTEFVRARLGRRYIDPPPFDLAASFADSHKLAPLIFILSPGSDIMTGLLKFAEDRGFGGAKLQSISLGQGQGPVAAQMIKNAVKSGTWVILQNCHLAVSWLPALEKMVEDWLPEAVHKDFRLWLTSYPSDRFPVSLLQNGVKMTNEPPAGLRANLLRSFTSDPISGDKFLSTTSKSGTGVGDLRFAKLLHGLCFFHALVQERKTFGPLGWNIPYEFNDSDLQISLRQLQKLLREYPEPPWKALSYLTGECNYGGRVTDDNDRRTLMGLLSIVYTPELLDADYKLSSSGLYSPPGIASMDPMIRDIQALPVQAHPEVFGLHENANITKDFAEANQLILSAQASVTSSSTSGGSATLSAAAEDALTALTTSILDQLPPNFDIDAVQKQFPVKYEDSMNTVLVQELVRYNRLLTLIRSSLVDVKKALKGLIVMSRELEEMTASMALAKIPEMWLSRSYPSLKPLGGYISDFINRLAFMQKWIDDGRPPNVFWISGFYFTQSFLAGILQNYARKHQLPIDILTFRFEVTKHVSDADITSTPESGVYIRGFYLEGARWNSWRKFAQEAAGPDAHHPYCALPHERPNPAAADREQL